MNKSFLEEGGMQTVKRIVRRPGQKQFIILEVREWHRVAESAAKSQWWKRSNKWIDKGDTISKCPVTPIHLGYRLLNNSSSIKSAQFNIPLTYTLTVALRRTQWNQREHTKWIPRHLDVCRALIYDIGLRFVLKPAFMPLGSQSSLSVGEG